MPIGLDFYQFAFLELGTCRPPGFGLMPIPWTAIHAFAQAYGLEEEQADTLRRLVRAMDAAFLERHQKGKE